MGVLHSDPGRCRPAGLPLLRDPTRAPLPSYTYSARIAVPRGLTVANGGRLERVDSIGETVIYRYSSLKPSWRMDFAIAEYARLSSGSIQVFHFPATEAGAAGVADAAGVSVRVLPQDRELALDPVPTAANTTSSASWTVLLSTSSPRQECSTRSRDDSAHLHRLAGIVHGDVQARTALEAPAVRRARDRLPLMVGFAGSMLATLVVSRFEAVLSARVAVAYFIPGIVYLADAIGTQTEAIVVRGLSHGPRTLRPLLGGELRTGVLIGVALGLPALAAVWLSFGDARLAISVALGVVVAGAVATSVGLLLPWLLQAAGRDPAFGSGPLATIIQDLLTIVIYFVIVTLLVV